MFRRGPAKSHTVVRIHYQPHIKPFYKRTIESEFRDFKIKLLNGDIKLSINNDIINKNKKVLSFILDNFSDDIISGSLALSLYGLMNHRVRKYIIPFR